MPRLATSVATRKAQVTGLEVVHGVDPAVLTLVGMEGSNGPRDGIVNGLDQCARPGPFRAQTINACSGAPSLFRSKGDQQG